MSLKHSLQKTWASGPQQARASCEGILFSSLQTQQVAEDAAAANDGAGAVGGGEAMRVARAVDGFRRRGLFLMELLRRRRRRTEEPN